MLDSPGELLERIRRGGDSVLVAAQSQLVITIYATDPVVATRAET